MDWKTRKTRFLPGSEDLAMSAWSPDGRHIAATDGVQLRVFDIRNERWIFLASGKAITPPYWSRSGKYVYYQDEFEPEQPIWRVSIDGRKVERMMSSRQIPQSDLSGYELVGLAPDDAPIASIVRTNSDIYALELELP